MPNYPKLLVISDVAVIPQPDFKQKTILIGYLTRIANLIGIKTPKIACIAPSEQLLPSVLSRPKPLCSPRWAIADSWVTSSSTVRCRST